MDKNISKLRTGPQDPTTFLTTCCHAQNNTLNGDYFKVAPLRIPNLGPDPFGSFFDTTMYVISGAYVGPSAAGFFLAMSNTACRDLNSTSTRLPSEPEVSKLDDSPKCLEQVHSPLTYTRYTRHPKDCRTRSEVLFFHS